MLYKNTAHHCRRCQYKKFKDKGTVRPDWICIRVVPSLDRPGKGHQPDAFLYEAVQNFEIFSKIQDQN
jgi:hypothetical protein